jgi:MerR family transcriptional regulator, light-induced transcriptional regulator
MNKKHQHPIRAVAHRTGLPAHIIRVWEKRYKAVVPNRSETNRRSYTEEDIERLKALKLLTDGGHRISQIAPLPLTELKELLELMGEDLENAPEPIAKVPVEELLKQSFDAIENLNPRDLDYALTQAALSLSPLAMVEEIIAPLIRQVREQCRKGKLRVLHLQFAQPILRTFLMNSAKSYDVPFGAPPLVVATLTGQQQEVESHFILIAASASGWQNIFFGTQLSAEEIAAGVHRLSPKILALSLINPKTDPLFHIELARLKKLVSEETKILVVGRGADVHAATLTGLGTVPLASLEKFQEYLETFNGRSGGPD